MKLTWTTGACCRRSRRKWSRASAAGQRGTADRDKGTILHGSHGADGVRLIPETRMRSTRVRPKPCAASPGSHEGDWIRPVRKGRTAAAALAVRYGGALTEMVLLGVLAIRMKDQRLEWDSQNLRFTNNEKANELLRIQYRDGWTL